MNPSGLALVAVALLVTPVLAGVFIGHRSRSVHRSSVHLLSRLRVAVGVCMVFLLVLILSSR